MHVFLKWIRQNLALLFRRPHRHQVAALCYRDSTKNTEILLITTRGGNRWILPKGWPMLDRSDGESALQEAYEEAGIHGEINTGKVGSVIAKKKLRKDFFISIKTDVYAIKVTRQDNNFPEVGQREIAWFKVEDAIKRIGSEEMSYVLKKWSDDFHTTH